MPRKKMGRLRNQKRKNSSDDDDDGNTSHSESTTNKKNRSESWKCPVSAKRNLIPNARTTFARRLTLRSSTRPIETGKPPLRRSLRRHTTVPDDIQQLDDTSDTMNAAHQVSEGSDQVSIQSPSRYLVSVAYPRNVKPKFEHKKAEKVENSTVVIPNVVEEAGEGEPNNIVEEVGVAEPNNMVEEVGEAEPNNMAEEVGEAEPNDMAEEVCEAEPNKEVGEAEPNKEAGEGEPNNMVEEVGEAEPNNMAEEVGEAEPNNMAEEAGEGEPNDMVEEVGEAEPNNLMEEVGEAEPNMMEKEGEVEAEKSLSKDLHQEQGIPLEPESLAGGITNKNKRMCNSRVGCSFPLRSLKLTEMVEMVGMEDDDDEEIQSRPENSFKGYQVKEEFMPILIKIIGKYGDIAKNCVTESVEYRSWLLEMICGIISEFEKKDLRKIKEDVLKSKIAFVEGIKQMNVEVEWLRMRLIDVREARELLMQSGMLKEKTDQNQKLLEESKSALEKCEARKKEVEEQLKAICNEEAVCKENLARARNDSATITRIVDFARSKVRRFLHCSVVDGLL